MNISIIIPNHNGEDTVLKTISSIYSSNHINKHQFEIIVIDNKSLDSSVTIIKKNYPTARIIRLNENKGAAKARNRGIDEARYGHLLFIDSDAWFNRSSIDEMIKMSKEDTDIVFPKLIYEDGKELYPVLDVEKEYPNISGCFMIKKKSLEKLDEIFDEEYGTYLEDYDFFARCRLFGLKATYASEARVIHVNKKLNADYSRRYYLEIRNILYGRIKLRGLMRHTGMYDPFTMMSFFKCIFLGMCNFAWFNWYGYDRKDKRKSIIFSGKNKIFLNAPFIKAISLGYEAARDYRNMKKKAVEKNKKLRKLYN